MKKITRLTENDLTRLVKRVINEQKPLKEDPDVTNLKTLFNMFKNKSKYLGSLGNYVPENNVDKYIKLVDTGRSNTTYIDFKDGRVKLYAIGFMQFDNNYANHPDVKKFWYNIFKGKHVYFGISGKGNLSKTYPHFLTHGPSGSMKEDNIKFNGNSIGINLDDLKRAYEVLNLFFDEFPLEGDQHSFSPVAVKKESDLTRLVKRIIKEDSHSSYEEKLEEMKDKLDGKGRN